jgi:hypothetical protein
MNGIALRQVGIDLGIAQIIDSHNLDILAAGFEQGAQYIPANTAIAIDSNFNRHALSPVLCLIKEDQ